MAVGVPGRFSVDPRGALPLAMTHREVPARGPEDWRHEAEEPGGMPERLADSARRAELELREGRPGAAVQVLDGMLSDLEAWRRVAAEQANEDDAEFP